MKDATFNLKSSSDATRPFKKGDCVILGAAIVIVDKTSKPNGGQRTTISPIGRLPADTHAIGAMRLYDRK